MDLQAEVDIVHYGEAVTKGSWYKYELMFAYNGEGEFLAQVVVATTSTAKNSGPSPDGYQVGLYTGYRTNPSANENMEKCSDEVTDTLSEIWGLMSEGTARIVRRKGKWTVYAPALGHEQRVFDPTLPESYYEQACEQLLDTLSEQTARAKRGSGEPPSWWDPSKNHTFYEFEILGIVGIPDVGVVVFFSFDSEPDARYIYIADTTRFADLAAMDTDNPYLHQYPGYFGVGAAFDIFEETSLARLAEEDWSSGALSAGHDSVIRITRERTPGW